MTDNTNPLNPVTIIQQGAVVSASNPLAFSQSATPPAGVTSINNGATGSTGAVVATLAGTSGKTTYISGFNVYAAGGTAAVGPIAVAGITGGTQNFQMNSSAAGNTLNVVFSFPIPATATNTAITVTTTADGTASVVNVNAWGFQV